MKRAILSDIHANLPALEVVREDIRNRGITEVYNLGDTVGYGPFPRECVDAVRSFCTVNLRGNHDHAVLEPTFADRFNLMAQLALAWTREQLLADPTGAPTEFLKRCDPFQRVGAIVLCHASPRDNLEEYVNPADIFDYTMMRENFARIDSVAFVGHTHIPGVFIEFPGDYTFTPAGDFQGPTTLEPGRKVLINAGSVGQPRDGNPDACYVIYDDDANTIEFVRLAYPIDKTADAIRQIPDLNPKLADRLYSGS